MYGCNTLGIASGSSEASAPQGFKCIGIMGDSNGGSTTVRSRGGVLSREGPFSEVPLYAMHLYAQHDRHQYSMPITSVISSWVAPARQKCVIFN